MFTSSSLSPLSLLLSEVSVSSSFPSLPTKQLSSDSIESRNMYFATSAGNHFGHDACGGGDGGGGGGVFPLHSRFCVIGDFFRNSSGNCCPPNHKVTSFLPRNVRVNLRKPTLRAMLVLITR